MRTRTTPIITRKRMAEMLPRVGSEDSLRRARVPAPHEHCRFTPCASPLHPVVVRAAAAFWRNPGDDLVGVGDVTGLAVDAVRRVQAEALAVGLSGIVHHFIDVGGAEILAGAA